ncbi:MULTISPECIES: DUF2399 domain-containing protein [Streptomyces]|uniref:DUF2399 domain-containing protein n=1 Tax=Streptomyces liliifuscus TaxID=2797636 RepID=A0A7T7REI0_9ACTN|nr:DUF2399 domain-containing protein [Streptomyces liliifuscus]QQM43679.1 DUF2399 domain-containing protein [Streptomyces liliifuscus]
MGAHVVEDSRLNPSSPGYVLRDIAPGGLVRVVVPGGLVRLPPATRVIVCENPSVLEAATDELIPDCPALICTDGMPSNTALDLVAGLAAATDEITVRADIDDAGFVVVDQLLTAAPAATTWRYDVGTYLGHLGMTITGHQSVGMDTLRDLYEEHRVSIHEVALLTTLIDDLSHPRSW